MSLTNYYDILGCTKDSTVEDIKHAYYGLALKFHPDKNTTEFDREKFQQILEAWNVLRDPKSRERYDILQEQDDMDSKSVLVYETISVNQLQTIEKSDDTFVYPCRCGGLYYVEKDYIRKENQSIYVPCLECTFHVVIQT